MEEIKVGEYVRTRKGYIICDDEDRTILNPNEVNHSKNIIDLIEVGDFVNGYRVTDKYFFAGEVLVLETEAKDTNCKCLCNEDIKSILTKEQFANAEYRLKE